MDSPLLRVLVGPDHREFVVHRAMLCASSPFFRDSIDAVPEKLTPSSPDSTPSPPSSPSPTSTSSSKSTLIWLSGESADVFELFVLWLYRRHAFRAVVEDAVTILAREATPEEVITLYPEHPNNHEDDHDNLDRPSASANLSELHWHLVRLHLFAAIVDIPILQDAVMDSLQDLYLRFDWPATPALLRYLYIDADPVAACRLRKWAVALIGWTLANSRGSDDDLADMRALTQLSPLLEEYSAHTAKMAASRADARIKNPQLRLPSNQLRREDRHFGFRQCSFHSHRKSAGEGRCPHERARRRGTLDFCTSLALPPPLAMPIARKNHHSPSASLTSLSSTSSEPRLEDLPVWSPLSVTTPGYAPLGMESTI